MDLWFEKRYSHYSSCSVSSFFLPGLISLNFCWKKLGQENGDRPRFPKTRREAVFLCVGSNGVCPHFPFFHPAGWKPENGETEKNRKTNENQKKWGQTLY